MLWPLDSENFCFIITPPPPSLIPSITSLPLSSSSDWQNRKSLIPISERRWNRSGVFSRKWRHGIASLTRIGVVWGRGGGCHTMRGSTPESSQPSRHFEHPGLIFPTHGGPLMTSGQSEVTTGWVGSWGYNGSCLLHCCRDVTLRPGHQNEATQKD